MTEEERQREEQQEQLARSQKEEARRIKDAKPAADAPQPLQARCMAASGEDEEMPAVSVGEEAAR